MPTILPLAETQFTDINGVPLALGTVTFYVPGTTTPKDTWQDSAGSLTNTNPVDLDLAGRAIIWGSGAYRQIVKDRLGNTIWDQITEDPGSDIATAVTETSVGGVLTVPFAGLRQVIQVTLHENISTVTLTGFPTNGWNLLFEFIQPATQSYTITWPTTGWFSPGGPKPVMTANPLGVSAIIDLISVIPGVTGNIYVGSAGQDQIGGL